jgi:acyl-ACP thioesterase
MADAMKQTIWTQTYQVNTLVLNDQKRLGLLGLLNLLQDAAWIHAQHAGWGYEDLMRQGTIWVLARQKVVMTDWPAWGDVVTIRTWGRGAAGLLALRDYEIMVADRKVGECTTSWLMLDWQTRRPQKLDRVSFDRKCRVGSPLTIDAGKIAWRDDLHPAATFQVRNSDLDVNGHVNNTHYAQWIVDSLTCEELGAYRLGEYEVNFLSETRVGDAVIIDRGLLEPSGAASIRCQFQGRRANGDKPIFVARLCARPALRSG